MNAELMLTYERMKSDLEAAARIQRSLLPTTSPLIDGVRVAWNLIPCEELAGDSLGLIRLDDNHLGMYILDVSGHGLEAALLAMTLHRVLAAMVCLPKRNGSSPCPIVPPQELCGELNRIFPMDPETSQYFTLLYGIYNTRKCHFRYATAGHHTPIYLSPSGAAIEKEKAGFPVGIVENAEYEEQVIDIEPGGRLFLYSDGMIDAECFYDGPFGKSRLIKMMQCTRRHTLRDSVTKTVERVRDWSSTARLEDDASLLALEIKSAL